MKEAEISRKKGRAEDSNSVACGSVNDASQKYQLKQ